MDWTVKVWNMNRRDAAIMTFTSASDVIYDVQWCVARRSSVWRCRACRAVTLHCLA
jgi:hypothetical protein